MFFLLKESAAFFLQKLPFLKLTQVPENRPSQRKHAFQPSIFRGYFSFRGGNYNKKIINSFSHVSSQKVGNANTQTHEFMKNMALSPKTLAFQIPPGKVKMFLGSKKGVWKLRVILVQWNISII